jgi:CheY-like chemotaxis protein
MSCDSSVVLLVEDDPAHAEIVRRNFEGSRSADRLINVADGESALNYLFRRVEFQNPGLSPRPDLILLDLRLPKLDGLEVIKTVKSDPDLSCIPLVVLTASGTDADIAQAYGHHANSYLVKPANFSQFLGLLETLSCYWLAWNKCSH